MGKLEKEQQPPENNNPDYITAAQANDDISSYFDGLSAQPQKIRSMASSSAQQDLMHFFKVLEKGDIAGLLPRAPQPSQMVVSRPGDREMVKRVAGRYAGEIVERDEKNSVRKQEARYNSWRRHAVGRVGEGKGRFIKDMIKEEEQGRRRAERDGRRSAAQWNSLRQRYFTDTPGSDPARLGEVEVPRENVRMAR